MMMITFSDTIDVSLLGCCTRFSCFPIKGNLQLAKITVTSINPIYPNPSPPTPINEFHVSNLKSPVHVYLYFFKGSTLIKVIKKDNGTRLQEIQRNQGGRGQLDVYYTSPPKFYNKVYNSLS